MKEIALIVQQTKGLGFAQVKLLDSRCEARIDFEMLVNDRDYAPGSVTVRAVAGAPRRAGGKQSLDSQEEVFQRRSRAAAYHQTRGEDVPDLETARRILAQGVGNGALQRFFAQDAWEIVEVRFQDAHWSR